MTTQSLCTSCCLKCRSVHPRPSPGPVEDTYALERLLKVGTVSIRLGNDTSADTFCDHVHASDGWHPYNGASRYLPLTNLSDVKLCEGLEFLANHCFVDATYRVTDDKVLIIRVYAVPYDLPGTKGALRNRKDGLMGPGRRHMRSLLQRLTGDWKGEGSIESDSVFPKAVDRRTLAEIYSELPSPQPVSVPGYGGISARLLDDGDDLDGLGLHSTLHRYQRRSVAALVQHESDTHSIENPVYLPLTTLDGRLFYFQPGTMEILLEKQMVSPCRGGILCEELGTGKTVMIIGLILATLKQVPKPEESLLDERSVMTPLSFRHFPSAECIRSRSDFDLGQEPIGNRVPSLVELMVDSSRTRPFHFIPKPATLAGAEKARRIEEIEEKFEALPIYEACRASTPFYFHFERNPTDDDRPGKRRRQTGRRPKRMYLSTATLVVVPANLLSQWDREILKHASHPLRVFILRSKTPLPTVHQLAADYDIILTTYTRFTTESQHTETSKLYSRSTCKCPEIPGTRVPDCKCQQEVSAFLQIRWKRLVIDEGHVSSSVSTVLTHFAKALSVERRWIVTGTPTTNLLGLGLGKRTMEESTIHQLEEPVPPDEGFPMDVDSHDTFMGAGNAAAAVEPSLQGQSTGYPMDEFDNPSAIIPASSAQPRIWNKYDREDLRKLGNMISNFIAMPQFASDSRMMTTHVTEPLLDPNGPRPGAISVLSQVMNTVMIRHRVEDVEAEIVLPPLTHESVLLELDPLLAISYNALQAVIAINAVDSERKDQDYLFHPANVEFLQLALRNMSQLMFWHVDENLFNIEALHASKQDHFDRALKRGASADDIKLLDDAFRHVAIAANHPLWRAVQEHEDVVYSVSSMPPSVFDAWTRIPTRYAPPAGPSHNGYLHADRLVKLYDMLLKKPLIKEEEMINHGQAIAKHDAEIRRVYLESQKKSNKTGRRSTQIQAENATSHSQVADIAAKKAASKETLKEMQEELDQSMALLENDSADDLDDNPSEGQPGATIPPPPGDSSKLSRLALSSCLAQVKIGSSASSKLNYIVNEVLKYSSTEKLLIFSDSDVTLAHIAEALTMIHVKFLRFTAQIPPQYREQLVLTFETSETYRVFLMELKHGARGLNLVSASRVIFCEPVWQADVESQAIKRVHRIGQTRPISVKTLAIKGSAEEVIVARRHALHNTLDKLPKLIEEVGMRDFVANPRFIETAPQLEYLPGFSFPLVDLSPLGTPSLKLKTKVRTPDSAHSNKRVRLGEPCLEDESTHSATAQTTPKKARTIRFA
ncbi:SNF2 family N-terminal domain-containing protein [Coprinopsis sp. MPI-PUGE-AT-0042]|nr:SNF2 family N-terminal domain-containing protein [Coprinopsis sp. MPI-PUGE-AT-0042]